MHFTYTIEENDLVAFNLQIALNTEDTKKKRKISTYILTILAVCFTLFFIYRHEMAMAVVTLIIGIVTILFYPKYFNQQYKKQFHIQVKKMYPNRIGKDVELECTDTHAVLKTEPDFLKLRLRPDDTKRLLNQCQRAKWIEIIDYRDFRRKPHQRWSVTDSGRMFAGLSAPTAPTSGDGTR
jgi:hypothetical protein